VNAMIKYDMSWLRIRRHIGGNEKASHGFLMVGVSADLQLDLATIASLFGRFAAANCSAMIVRDQRWR
jgi:hypothetical protein